MLRALTSPLRTLSSLLDHLSDTITGEEHVSSNAPPGDTVAIADISGNQFVKGTQAWENNKYQYATSSHGIDHDMNPAIVIQPKNKEDIKKTLEYAKRQGVAVAVRTGGHQYR